VAPEHSQQPAPIDLLDTALRQTEAVLANVREDQLEAPTPCEDWTVAELVDHLVAAPGRFAAMMRGERPDFASSPRTGTDRAERFRAGGDDLLGLWREQRDAAEASVAWQLAELAVHTWDLAKATGQPTDRLEAEVARVGLEFMRENLSAENRGQAFRPEQPAPEGATPYEQIAAFAGRRP
jgi:uncharacterized protein (TIGR03086 family)